MDKVSVAAIQSPTVVLVKKEKEVINSGGLERLYYHLTFSDGENLYSCTGDRTCYILQVLQEYDASELKRVCFCRDIIDSVVKSLNSDVCAYENEIFDLEERLSDIECGVSYKEREAVEHQINNRKILIAAYQEIADSFAFDDLGISRYRAEVKE